MTKIVGTGKPVGEIRVCATIEEAIAADPEKIFKGHGLLVINHPPWTADFEVLLAGLEKKARKFKERYFTVDPQGELARQIKVAQADATRMFAQLYPNFSPRDGQHTRIGASWRPMITAKEPVHYDTYGGAEPLVTSYMNVSAVPRVYKIGPTLGQLCALRKTEMRKLFKKKGVTADDVIYILRQQGDKGLLGAAPRVRVELAPRSIWFFNAKTLAHEVVYGEGAIGVSWEVPGATEMPQQILRSML